jgi:two-component system, OmpR family, response regulator
MLAFSGVTKGRILIILDDEWESALLSKFLGEAGYEVHIATEARAGFEQVRALEPDCILCDVNLPDIDGFWVARRVRTEPSRIATTPFLFLVEADDAESRLQGLNVGADVYLVKPFRNEEVTAQVGALIDMANRLRQQRDALSADGPASSRSGAAFHGDVAQMSVSTVLTLLELEQRTGRITIRAEDGKVALLELKEGALTAATLDGKVWEPTPLVREALAWKRGRFTFRNGEIEAAAGARQSISGIILEAMRLEDEARRG